MFYKVLLKKYIMFRNCLYVYNFYIKKKKTTLTTKQRKFCGYLIDKTLNKISR